MSIRRVQFKARSLGPYAIMLWRPRLQEDDVHTCLPCLSAPLQQESMPFAVVGSDKEYQVNGKRVLGRKTPWGIIEGNSVHLLEELAAGQLCSLIKHV